MIKDVVGKKIMGYSIMPREVEIRLEGDIIIRIKAYPSIQLGRDNVPSIHSYVRFFIEDSEGSHEI